MLRANVAVLSFRILNIKAKVVATGVEAIHPVYDFIRSDRDHETQKGLEKGDDGHGGWEKLRAFCPDDKAMISRADDWACGTV